MAETLPAMDTPTRYSNTAIALHWLLALALFGTFALGIYMHELPLSPAKLKYYSWHKWAGVTLLALSFGRLAWRLTHRPPADASMPAWQAKAAHLTPGLLYMLFFAVPLSGWAYSSSAGFPVVWMGALPLPDFVPVDRDLAETFKGLHKLLTLSMAALVLLHIGAALKHHWVDRDGLLARMRPSRAA